MPNHATYADSLEELGGVDPSSQIPLLSYPPRGGSPPPSGSGIVGSVSHESLLSVENSATTSLSPGEGFTSSQENISEGKAALYAALPLNTRTSIRVLDLEESEDGPVTGQLRVVDLDEHPFFTALSYVWGEYSEPKDTISCNGHLVEVTKNCLSALRQMRGFGPLTIWVDSICIDQDNVHEKSVQIPLMGRLYSSTGAQAVYVWLGEGTKDTDAAMDYFGKGGLPFSFLISKNARDGQTWENGVPTGNSMALRLSFYLYFRSITIRIWPHYKGIQDLLSRPWVERLWTLQEVLLSDKVIIVCGKKAIPLQALAYSVKYMEFFRWHSIGVRFPRDLLRWQRLVSIWTAFFGNGIVNADQDRTLYQELELHQKYLQRGWLFFKILLGAHFALFFLLSIGIAVFPRLTNATLIYYWIIRIAWFFAWPSLVPFAISIGAARFRFYPYKSSESLFIEIHGRKSLYAKDKFYATHSLLRSEYDTPDYTTSGVKLVYRYLFMDLLTHTRNLDILLFTSHSKVRRSPSWVINWSTTRPSWIDATFHHGSRFNKWYNKQLNLFSRTSLLITKRYPCATPGSKKRWSFCCGEQYVIGFSPLLVAPSGVQSSPLGNSLALFKSSC